MASRAPSETVSAIFKTALPFLYQTKTLTASRWLQSPRIVNDILRRSISESARPIQNDEQEEVQLQHGNGRRDSNYQASPSANRLEDHTIESQGEPRFIITKVLTSPAVNRLEDHTTESQGEPRLSIKKVLRDFNKTLPLAQQMARQAQPENTYPKKRLPKTIPYMSYSPRAITSQGRPMDEFDEFESTGSGNFDESTSMESESYEETDAIDALTIKSDPRTEGTSSTITSSERQAFQKIFADVYTRYRQHMPGETTTNDIPQDMEQDWKKTEIQRNNADGLLGNIMGKAIVHASPDREKMEEIVERYPKALRGAAARAIGLDVVKKMEMAAVEVEEAKNNEKLEELQNAERERVEGLMHSAESDFALWAVMQEEVFPLIDKLGLGNPEDVQVHTLEEGEQAAGVLPKKARRSKQKTDNVAAPPKTIVLDTVENGVSSLALYGPLYPSYLLLGLRLLDRSFAKPSPLTLSILPKIKELGRISHVLGASTQLYNELIFIHWYRRNDFRGASALIDEMEKYGLDFDAETLQTVERIHMMQRATKEGQRGPVLQTLWDFPEFAPNGFGVLAARIKETMKKQNKSMELSY
jgi:hypothetical protein